MFPSSSCPLYYLLPLSVVILIPWIAVVIPNHTYQQAVQWWLLLGGVLNQKACWVCGTKHTVFLSTIRHLEQSHKGVSAGHSWTFIHQNIAYTYKRHTFFFITAKRLIII